MRRHIISIVGLLPAITACARPSMSASADPSGPAVAATSKPSPACAAMRTAVREKMCENPGDCDRPELPCSHTLDFDGDGAADRAELAHKGDTVVLRVHFGSGREDTVGAGPVAVTEYREGGDVGRTLPAGFSWIVAWTAARRTNAGLHVHGREFDHIAGRGDGLWMSGGDAAAMLVLTADGWLVIELGY